MAGVMNDRKPPPSLDDLDAKLGLVREEHPDVPVALVGHSMGGLVVTTYLCERNPPVQAAATSGALLELTDDLPSWRLWLFRALRRDCPNPWCQMPVWPTSRLSRPKRGQRPARKPPARRSSLGALCQH